LMVSLRFRRKQKKEIKKIKREAPRSGDENLILTSI
jgi:hypothetical protein